jgi:hypothetical protein
MPELPKNDIAQEKITDKKSLFASLFNMQRSGCTVNIRPYQSSLVTSDMEFQELAYVAGYLRASLQTLKE